MANELPASCSRCDHGEGFHTSVFLDFCTIAIIIDDYKELLEFEISDKKITLQQEPNESLSLSCRITEADGHSMYACNLKLSFDNNLNNISQSYAYDISLKALVSKNGDTLHMPLFSERMKRKESTISSDVSFFMNTVDIDDIEDSKIYHLCCTIKRVNLKSPSANPKLDIGEALWQQRLLSDVRLNVGTWQFAHRAILGLSSPVLLAMFSHENTSESLTGVVKIDDIEAPVFEAMLRYVYTSRTDGFISEFPAKLFKAAHKYEITGLMDKCQEAMMVVISRDNVVEFLDLARIYDLETTKSGAMAFIAKYENDMVKEPSYQEFLRRDLNLDTLVYTLKLAAKYTELSKVKDVAFEFVKQNCQEVAKNEEYLGLFLSHPKLMQEAFVYMSRQDS